MRAGGAPSDAPVNRPDPRKLGLSVEAIECYVRGDPASSMAPSFSLTLARSDESTKNRSKVSFAGTPHLRCPGYVPKPRKLGLSARSVRVLASRGPRISDAPAHRNTMFVLTYDVAARLTQ